MGVTATDANGVVGPAKPDENRLQEIARAYRRRCHEVGLELIGVTDHNFSQKTDPRDWLLTHLVEQNKSVARHLGRTPLHILPGFDGDIGWLAVDADVQTRVARAAVQRQVDTFAGETGGAPHDDGSRRSTKIEPGTMAADEPSDQ